MQIKTLYQLTISLLACLPLKPSSTNTDARVKRDLQKRRILIIISTATESKDMTTMSLL